jgi:hypothetical protein
MASGCGVANVAGASKQEFQRHLADARVSHAGHGAELRATINVSIHIKELRVVEDIEKLCAKLQVP